MNQESNYRNYLAISRFIGFIIISLFNSLNGMAQIMGIGVDSSTRARLEVHGTAGNGTTTALFGGNAGITFQRNYPAIGFNALRSSNSSISQEGEYMSNGAATVISLKSLPYRFAITNYPTGTAGQSLTNGKTILSLMNSHVFVLGQEAIPGTAAGVSLRVLRGTGIDGSAVFGGSTYASHFYYSAAEHTYIRGGRVGARIFVNDLPMGTIKIGRNNSTKVGLNAPDPQYAFEVRQVNGTGLKLIYNSTATQNWEWRVGSTSSDLLLLFNGVTKSSFSTVDGAMSALSDGRFKTNITEMGSVMSRILQLNPVTYEINDADPVSFRSIGFIAQEVAQIFPEMVGTKKDINLKVLDYSGFHAITIKGIQEEQEKIERLSSKASALETKLALLEKIIAEKTQNKN